MIVQLSRRGVIASVAGWAIIGCAKAQSVSSGPIFVLIEKDPWAMVIGSDSPRFSLYSDGTVIFKRGKNYNSVTLNAGELERLMLELGVDGLRRFKRGYQTVSHTDAHSEVLLSFANGAQSRIEVYGKMRTAQERASVPKELVATYDRACAFDHPEARPWLPLSIEVMVWSYDYAPEPSILWPAKWPDIKDSRTVTRGEGRYSLYVPSADYSELQQFLATRNEKGAVEINGKKWAVATRMPFPNEAEWMT